MKMKWSLFCGLAVFCGLSVQAHAQIMTTDVGTEANTSASYLEAVEQYIQQGQQYAMQGEQYAQQVEQYVQQVKNAKGLGDVLGDLTGVDLDNLRSVNDDIMATQNVLSNLDPDSGGYVTQARNLLEKSYNLPTQGLSAAAEIQRSFGSERNRSNASDPNSAAYDLVNRDTDQVMKNENAIAAVHHDRQKANSTIADQDAVLTDLTDDDVGATTQLMAAQNSIIEHQNDQNIRLQEVISNSQQEQRIRELEIENKRAEESLSGLKQIKNFINN